MDSATKKLLKLKAEIIAAAGHPIRLAIIEFLRDGEQCVCDIAAFVGSQRSNVSRHLAVLLKAGVIDYRKDGLKMLYTLRTACLLRFLDCVTDVLRERIEGEKAILTKCCR